jgi:hypothetical protein
MAGTFRVMVIFQPGKVETVIFAVSLPLENTFYEKYKPNEKDCNSC